MSSRSGPPPGQSPAADLTPALLQPLATLRRRRRLMLAANGATLALVLAGMVTLAAHDGFSPVDGVLLLCALAITPWNAIGFWNALGGIDSPSVIVRVVKKRNVVSHLRNASP